MPDAQVNGTSINYRFDGPESGPVVTLSNSLASNLSMWEPQVDPLVDAGFRVLRYDSRGHGASAAPEGPYSMELLAEDALALMDTVGVSRTVLCGLSKGGMVGQMLATRHGDRLSGVALCATAAHMSPANIWDDRIKAVREGGMQAVVDGTIDRWFTKPGQTRLPAEVARVREGVLNTPVEGFCACVAAIREMDQREAIRDVTIPTLVMVGEEDPGTPVSASELIHDRIPGSTLQVIPEAAHFVNVEQSGAFNRHLLAFVEAHRP